MMKWTGPRTSPCGTQDGKTDGSHETVLKTTECIQLGGFQTSVERFRRCLGMRGDPELCCDERCQILISNQAEGQGP